MSKRAAWTSKTGFLLAALGSAIGLGNIWRFPYMAFRNGGGAFLVPYFVALFVVGIPLLMLEFGLGHYFRRAFPQSLGKIHPRFAWIGWWSVSFVMFGIVVYYTVVIAWCANYLIFAVTQPWGDVQNVDSFFDETFLGAFTNGQPLMIYDPEAAGLGFQLGQIRWPILIALILVWLANWLITRRQLQNGIELANKVFIPLLIGLTLLLVIWSWNYDGASAGRHVYLTPDWSQVFRPEVWIDAFSQIFFTLSIGFGIMTAYASYLPPKTDIPSSAFLAAMGNCAFSVFAAFAVFAAIGMLADQRGLDLTTMLAVERKVEELEDMRESDPAAFINEQSEYEQLRQQNEENQAFQSQMSTFGLLFKTYPAILSEMGPTSGRIFGVLFFMSLVVAGLSSSISIVEAFMASLSDQFGWDRNRMSATICSIAFLLGIVFCTQAGLFILDLVDHFITTYGLVFVAICESLIVGWIFPARRLRTHLDEHRDFRFGQAFSITMRVMISIMLMLTWLGLLQLDAVPIAAAIGRFALLASAIYLWVDEHWLDFDIRILIPALLIALLDQALVREFNNEYGGYHLVVILSLGVAWTAGTLIVGIILSCIPGRKETQG